LPNCPDKREVVRVDWDLAAAGAPAQFDVWVIEEGHRTFGARTARKAAPRRVPGGRRACRWNSRGTDPVKRSRASPSANCPARN